MSITWNPADLFQMTLSSGNLTATGTNGISVVRATAGASSGKPYFEFTLNAADGYPYVGLMLGSVDLTNNWYNGVAQDASHDGFAWNVCGNGYRFHNADPGGTPPSLSGAQITGGVLGIGYAFSTKTFQCFRNGSPVGTGFVTDIPDGTLYPAFSIGQSPWTPCVATFTGVQYLPSGYNEFAAASSDHGFLMQILNGALVGVKGAAKSALTYFDGSKWAVKEAGTTGQILSIDSNGDLAWVAQTSGGTPADGSITNAKLATVATATIKGRTTAGTGAPEDLTAAQVRAILNVADGATAGSAPQPVFTFENFSANAATPQLRMKDSRTATYIYAVSNAAPSANMTIKLYKNGSTELASWTHGTGSAASSYDMADAALVAGDYLHAATVGSNGDLVWLTVQVILT